MTHPDEPDASGDAGPVPHRFTRRQRLIRTLFYFFGPAQNSPPPYATPDEQARYYGSPEPPRQVASAPPPGFQMREYTDSAGVVHRYAVPRDPEDPSPQSDIPH